MEPLNELFGNEIAALLAPTTVTLVTARDEDGKDKVATIAWVMPVSHEPSLMAVVIRPGGQTACAMRARGEFIVNVLPATEKAQKIAMVCGKKTGVEDRFEEAGLSFSEGAGVDAARIDQAVSWIECRVIDSHLHGDHELFIGETVRAQTRGKVDEAGKLDPVAALLIGQRGRFGRFEKELER